MRFASSITERKDTQAALAELLSPIDERITRGMVDLALVFSTAHFDEKRICRLVDHYEPVMKQQFFTYLSEYGAKLGMSADA
jgi:hypothetical protein